MEDFDFSFSQVPKQKKDKWELDWLYYTLRALFHGTLSRLNPWQQKEVLLGRKTDFLPAKLGFGGRPKPNTRLWEGFKSRWTGDEIGLQIEECISLSTASGKVGIWREGIRQSLSFKLSQVTISKIFYFSFFFLRIFSMAHISITQKKICNHFLFIF